MPNVFFPVRRLVTCPQGSQGQQNNSRLPKRRNQEPYCRHTIFDHLPTSLGVFPYPHQPVEPLLIWPTSMLFTPLLYAKLAMGTAEGFLCSSPGLKAGPSRGAK